MESKYLAEAAEKNPRERSHLPLSAMPQILWKQPALSRGLVDRVGSCTLAVAARGEPSYLVGRLHV